MKKLTFLFVFILFLAHSSIDGQSTKMRIQEGPKVSIAPLYPNACPGVPSKVSCTGEFENYEWLGIDVKFESTGRNIEVTQPGRYQLIVQGLADDPSYMNTYDFIVIISDIDADGVCDRYDCAPSNPLVSTGIICDDGNPCTENDVFDEECNCIGTPKPDCDFSIPKAKDSKLRRIQARLSSAYLVNIRKDYTHASSFENLFKKISRVPNAAKLVEKGIKIEMRKLSSAELKDFFSDIMSTRYSPEYIGNHLKTISPATIRAWRGLWKTPIQFRAHISKLDSVEMYMEDFDKTSSDISQEIIDATRGYEWWYNNVVARQY